jgi:radical SAM protein with 4Fe4S-binding SPASM domain
MYPDFMDLGEYICDSGCLLSVNTNGTFLAENADRIVKSKWHGIFVSLDGFEETNDAIRGKGSYKRVVEGFKAINKAKQKSNSNLPYMGIVTTVSKLNYLYLHDLAAAAGDFGLSWHIINLGTYTNDEVIERHREFMGRELDTEITCLPAYNTGLNEGIDGEKFKEILKKVHATDNGYPIITVPVIDPDKIGEYYSDLDVFVRDNCTVPWSSTNIDYNGDVHFCADYPDYVIGNIMEDSFFNIWNNERAQSFRKALKESPRGMFPGCVRCYQAMLCGHRCAGY